MKFKTFLIPLISVLCIVTISAAKKTGGGKPGGGGSNTTYPVEFVFDDSLPGSIIGSDGGGAYQDGIDGVRAEFVPAGNPILSLRSKKIQRDLWIDYSGCKDELGTPLTDGASAGIRTNAYVSHVGGVFTSGGGLLADNVILMGIGDSGFTEMDTTYSPPTSGREGFSIRFGGEPESQNIKITRDSQTQWTVENIQGSDDASTAAVGTVRNGSFVPKGHCDINVRMTITCPTCPLPPAP